MPSPRGEALTARQEKTSRMAGFYVGGVLGFEGREGNDFKRIANNKIAPNKFV